MYATPGISPSIDPSTLPLSPEEEEQRELQILKQRILQDQQRQQKIHEQQLGQILQSEGQAPAHMTNLPPVGDGFTTREEGMYPGLGYEGSTSDQDFIQGQGGRPIQGRRHALTPEEMERANVPVSGTAARTAPGRPPGPTQQPRSALSHPPTPDFGDLRSRIRPNLEAPTVPIERARRLGPIREPLERLPAEAKDWHPAQRATRRARQAARKADIGHADKLARQYGHEDWAAWTLAGGPTKEQLSEIRSQPSVSETKGRLMSWRHNKLVRAAFDEQHAYKRQPNKATYAQQRAFEKSFPTDEQFAEMARKEKKKGNWTRSRDMKEGSATFGQMVSEFKGETVKDVEQRLRDRWDSRRRQLGVEIPGFKDKKKQFDQYGRDYREAQLNERFLKNVDRMQTEEVTERRGAQKDTLKRMERREMEGDIGLQGLRDRQREAIENLPELARQRDPRNAPVNPPGPFFQPRSALPHPPGPTPPQDPRTAPVNPPGPFFQPRSALPHPPGPPPPAPLTLPLDRHDFRQGSAGRGSMRRWKQEEADARRQILDYIEADPTRPIPAEYYREKTSGGGAGYDTAIEKAQKDYLGQIDSEIAKLKHKAHPVGRMGATRRVETSERDTLKKRISDCLLYTSDAADE